VNGLTDSKVALHDYFSYFREHDVILLQETLSHAYDPALFRGYRVFLSLSSPSFSPLPLPHKRGLGMLIAVRDHSGYSAQLWGSTSSSLWVKVTFMGAHSPPLYVGGVYVPPEGSPRLQEVPMPHRMAELEGRIQEALLDGSVVLAGDFNARVSFASTSSSSVVPVPVGQNPHGRRLVDLSATTGLVLCTGRVDGDLHEPPSFPTPRGGTRPDHVLVSAPLLPHVTSIRVQDDLRGSDHYSLHVLLQIPVLHCSSTPLPLHKVSRVTWKGTHRRAYVHALEGEEPSLRTCAELAQSGDLPGASSLLMAVISRSATHAHMKVSRRESPPSRPPWKPFFTHQCFALKREWKRLGRQLGWRAPPVVLLERRYHSFVRSQKRSWLLTQLQDVIAMFHTEPRRFWRLLNGSPPPLPGPLCHPSAWESFAAGLQGSSVVDHAPLSEVAFPHQVVQVLSDLHRPFTPVEVEVALSALKPGRAAGLGGFPSEFLRFAQQCRTPEVVAPPHLLAPSLTAILNAMLGAGCLPPDHDILTVTPVLKDSSRSVLDTTNYRPIAVQDPLVRLYASLLNTRLVRYLEENRFRCPEQCGFRPGFSTLHALFTLQHFVDLATPTAPLYCCFLDLSKAYDRVPRHYLWEALRRLGVAEGFIRAVRSTYDGVRFTVVAGGMAGSFHASGAGVTQGSPISPTLFTVYADGLLRQIRATCPGVGPQTRDGTHVPAQMYADDLILLAETAEGLQQLIDAVVHWCGFSYMRINPIKTDVMVFPSSPESAPSFQWVCDGVTLPVVYTKKYLGVILSSVGGVGGTFGLLNGKMWATWSSLMRKYGNLQCAASIGLLLKLILMCVVPTASYACEIWGWRSFRSPAAAPSVQLLESSYLVMLKMLLGVRPSVATPILLAELGLQPLAHHWLKRMATFWNSLVSLPHDHLYALILRDSCFYGVTTPTPTWAGYFMKALIKVGYPYQIDCQAPHPIDMPSLRDLLRRHGRQPWEGLHVSPRLCPSERAQLCTYSRWFHSPSRATLSRLLWLRMSVSKLRVFHRFRMGVHNLPIDAGRRRGIPRSHRLCDQCQAGLVGDEHHLVFSCSALQPIRDRYPHLFRSPFRSLRQFVWQDDLQSVVNFIYDCFQFRS